jgi:hypothetical protein
MRIIIFLIIFSSSAFTQTKAILSTGLNFPTYIWPIHGTSSLARFWNVGINGGFAFEINIIGHLAISPSFEYNHYSFNSYYDDTIFLLGYSLKSSSGDASHVSRILMEMKLFDKVEGKFKIYFLTGGGYVIEKIGLIRVTWSQHPSSEDKSEIQFPSKNYWIHSAGFGFRLNVVSSADIDCGLKYFSNYSDMFHFSINIGAVCQL